MIQPQDIDDFFLVYSPKLVTCRFHTNWGSQPQIGLAQGTSLANTWVRTTGVPTMVSTMKKKQPVGSLIGWNIAAQLRLDAHNFDYCSWDAVLELHLNRVLQKEIAICTCHVMRTLQSCWMLSENRPLQDPWVYNTIPSIQYTHILVSSNNVYMNISHHSIINIFVKYPSPPQYNI